MICARAPHGVAASPAPMLDQLIIFRVMFQHLLFTHLQDNLLFARHVKAIALHAKRGSRMNEDSVIYPRMNDQGKGRGLVFRATLYIVISF